MAIWCEGRLVLFDVVFPHNLLDGVFAQRVGIIHELGHI
jgi:hypothetical protein